MSPALRSLLQRAPGAGDLAGTDVRVGRAEHPVCGDEVELSVRVRAGRIAELAWRARGCPASVAVAAAAHEALRDVELGAARAALAAHIDALGGLGQTERHALTLVLQALDGALVAAR